MELRALAGVVPMVAATVLAPGLQSPPPGLPAEPERAGMVLEAEATKTVTAGLGELADSPRVADRSRAALALGRIGSPAGVGLLLRLLGDDAPPVRAQAAFALGKIEYDLALSREDRLRGEAVAGLETALTDQDPSVAGPAAWSLGILDAGDTQLRAWLASASSRAADVRTTELVLGAWWRLEGADPAAVIPFTRAADAAIRLAAAHALRRLDDVAGLPVLESLLADPDAEVRLMAVRGLEAAPRRMIEERAVPLLRDPDWRIQCAAARWLAGSWSAAGAAVPGDAAFTAVLRRSLDRNLQVRRCAFEALGAVVDVRAVATDRLLEGLESEETPLREAALEGLLSGGDEALERAVDRLGVTGIPEEPSAFREHAMALVQAPVRVPLLLRLIRRVDSRAGELFRWAVREAHPELAAPALRLLTRERPEVAAALALDVVTAERTDPELLAPALRVLAELAATGVVTVGDELAERLWRLYFDQRTPSGPSWRGPALELLLQETPELVSRRGVLLLEDPDRLLRLRAFRALRQQESFAAAVEAFAGPLEGRLPPERDWVALAERASELEREPPRLTLESERGRTVLELRADWAPRTVLRIVRLAREGRLAPTVFHRVVPGFVAQGGALDPPPTPLPGEDSLVPYDRGAVGLALAGRDTGTSQLFITHARQPHLEGLYPIFGTVVEGQRALERLLPGDAVTLRLEQP